MKEVPKLTVFFPVEDDLKSWVSRMRQPRQAAETLLGKHVELRFVCELSHQASENGFPIFLRSELVRKVAPFLKVSIAAGRHQPLAYPQPTIECKALVACSRVNSYL